MKNSFLHLNIDWKILTEHCHTNGYFDLAEGALASGVNTPSHFHNHFSKTIYVLQGELTIYTETKNTVLQVGEHLLIPKSQSHTLAATGKMPSKILSIFCPGGFAQTIINEGKRNEQSQNTADKDLFYKFFSAIGDITWIFRGC